MARTRRSEEKKDTEAETAEPLSPEPSSNAKSPTSSTRTTRLRVKREALEQQDRETQAEAVNVDATDTDDKVLSDPEGGIKGWEAEEETNVDSTPSSPPAVKESDVAAPSTGPITGEKIEMSQSVPPPYYPYPSHNYHGYPPPYSHSPMWGYHSGYYPPPPHQYPMPSQSSKNATVSPYYPPPPSGPGQAGTQQQPPYPYPPAPYPYYGGYAPMPPPPMSPLMQQPLFSPGPSPYHSSSTPKSGHYTAGPTPYFPPSSDFYSRNETKPPAAKKLKSKDGGTSDEFDMITASPSFHEMEEHDKRKAKKVNNKKKFVRNNDLDRPLAAEEDAANDEDDVLEMDYDDIDDDGLENQNKRHYESTTSVASTATATEDGNSGINPMVLATYVKPRLPTNQEELRRRARKNSQSRRRAEARKARFAEIEAKHESERTAEEQRFLDEFERGRSRKNNRSRSRASENKERVDMILKKPESERTKIETQFLEQYTLRKQRKNEGDRLRRERLKMLGIDSKKPSGPKPSVTARGPLPPSLLARVSTNTKNKESMGVGDASVGGTGGYYPASPGAFAPDPYSPPRGHASQMPPPGYYGYPPPYWGYGAPLPPPTDEERSAQHARPPTHYSNSFSIYPTDKGPVATTTSWATPPRPGESKKQPIVTAGGSGTKDDAKTPASGRAAGTKAITKETIPAVTV